MRSFSLVETCSQIVRFIPSNTTGVAVMIVFLFCLVFIFFLEFRYELLFILALCVRVAAERYVPRLPSLAATQALVQRQLRQQLPGGPTAGTAGLLTKSHRTQGHCQLVRDVTPTCHILAPLMMSLVNMNTDIRL